MKLIEGLEAAARGSFPNDDGAVDVLPPPRGPCDAVVAFTAHSVVAAGVSQQWVADRLPREDFTGPMRADFLASLAHELAVPPGSLDVLLAAPGSDQQNEFEFVEVKESNSRTERAHLYRTEVRSYADKQGGAIVNIGRGVDGRWDLSIELEASLQSLGRGRALISAARELIPSDEFLFASVAPGNARCLRACIAAGFNPIGAEVLFLTRPRSR